MRTSDQIRISGAALLATPVRTCLTMLGIIIGVASIVSMAAIGAGAQSKVSEQIHSFGANVIMVNASAANSGRPDADGSMRNPIAIDDARAIAELATVRYAAPSVAGAARLVRGGKNWGTTVNGTTRDHFDIRGWQLAEGRFFSADDEAVGGQVIVLGAVVARKLFGDEGPVGQVVRISNTPFEVIGVLDDKGTAGGGQSQDDVAFVPLRTAKIRLVGPGGGGAKDRNAVNYILASATSADTIATATDDIDELMVLRHRVETRADKGFLVTTAASIVAAQEASTRTISALLGVVAGVSLMVGGISIMNIMLVSVTERTREIGLRLAIGARPRDIRIQFLMEAAALCVCGGLVGVAVGSGAAYAVALFVGWPVVLEPSMALLAVAFAGFVGIVFGYYPAKQAAALQPVRALRTD
jgi:putative ABC transport system permease protein